MTRQLFLTFSSLVAAGVGSAALVFPETLLAAKGVAPTAELAVWMRQVGVLILASGVVTFLARAAPSSAVLRGVLLGNGLLHLGLLPIELLALGQGVLTDPYGVAPSSALHAVFAGLFLVHARRSNARPDGGNAPKTPQEC